MKGFVEAIQEADLYLIEPSLRAIGSQIFKKKCKNKWRSVINAKNLDQIYINREESLTLYSALGHLLNGALDIIGPFPKAVGNKRYLLVGTNYFTKWVEAEPLVNIKDLDAKKFVWKNIVTQFGVPHTFISNNGLQFDSKSFKWYYCDLGITNRYSTPAYPQGNGQAEAVNKVIVNGLKKRLDDAKESE